MARPRKPSALKLLAGDQPCRVNRKEPRAPRGAGDCPDHLDDVGRSAWHRVTRRLDEMGVLTLADGEAIALYCSTYALWTAAKLAIDEDGLTLTSTTVIETSKRTTTRSITKTHPMLQVIVEAQRQMTRLLTQFGMTPSSRSSLHVQAKIEDDPILAFLAASQRPKAGRKGKA